jgi:hypothetical protein
LAVHFSRSSLLSSTFSQAALHSIAVLRNWKYLLMLRIRAHAGWHENIFVFVSSEWRRKRIMAKPIEVEFLSQSAEEHLPLADTSVDTVVMT